MMPEPLRILVVDDAPEHARMVEEFIRSGDAWPNAVVSIATNYDEGVAVLRARSFDVAFLDYWLGSRDGLTLLRDIRGKGIDTPVVVLTRPTGRCTRRFCHRSRRRRSVPSPRGSSV